jgi:hypothetical protein
MAFHRFLDGKRQDNSATGVLPGSQGEEWTAWRKAAPQENLATISRVVCILLVHD